MEIIIEKPTQEEIDEAKQWPIWEKEPSLFPWEYSSKERCLILEGKAIVTANDKEYSFGAGDYVIFPNGLKCTWEIKEKIKKHYNFS